MHWVRARLLSVIDRAASQASDPLDAIGRISFAHIAFAEKNPALPRLLLTTNPQLKRLTQEFLDGYETKLAGLLADARAPGVVRSDLDGEAAATLFIGIIQGLAIRFGRSEELDAQPRADSNRACEVKFIGIEAAPAAHRRAVSFNLRCCVG